MRKAILVAVLVMMSAACNVPLVAQTATQTPIPPVPLQPTLTLSPTPTLIPLTLPVTATLEVNIVATPQGSTRPELACKVLQQSLKKGSKFASKERFDISWMVKNAGTATWEPGVVELAYAGGSKMYQYQPVPLTHSSPPGDITILNADMVAPRTPDIYTMVWALRRGDEYFCKMSVTISVHL